MDRVTRVALESQDYKYRVPGIGYISSTMIYTRY